MIVSKADRAKLVHAQPRNRGDLRRHAAKGVSTRGNLRRGSSHGRSGVSHCHRRCREGVGAFLLVSSRMLSRSTDSGRAQDSPGVGHVWAWGVGTTAGVDTTDETAGAELVTAAELALVVAAAEGVLAGALGVGCPGAMVSVRCPPGTDREVGQDVWWHTDEITGNGRVGGRATGNAHLSGAVGPLVEELMAPSVNMGGGASEEGRSHESCLHVW